MNWMDVWMMGIVEGLTEFLPISSTGHLILTAKVLNTPPSEFLKSFEIFIQLGAIAAIMVLYWKTLILNWDMIKKIVTAFLPTALIGYLAYKPVKAHLLGNTQIVLWALFLGGLAMIVLEWIHRGKNSPHHGTTHISHAISYAQAMLIGVFQSLAIIPGVSRSAATILGGLTLGISRKCIVEFSFLLAVPTLASAAALDLIKTNSGVLQGHWPYLLTGFFVAFLTAMAAVKGLLLFIQKYNFIAFGIYRMLLAVVFWWLI